MCAALVSKLCGCNHRAGQTYHVWRGHEAGEVVVHILEHHEHIPHDEPTASLEILCIFLLYYNAQHPQYTN